MTLGDDTDTVASSGSAIDWAAAKRVFVEALDLPVDQRGVFIEAELSGDRETQLRVASLLEAHDRTNGFLVEPKPSEVTRRKLPERIGPYRPVQWLGEGGFGVVYRAKQEEPIAREVAIKVLRTGLDTPEVVARFRDERQYLAQLDHGDVVKVFDAGVTEDGTAYLVMEFVAGDPVTDFASRLGMNARLRLFARVCRAVHAVHQRGVIHRDLKPSNILVHNAPGDDVPRLRVIDFGIAAAVQRAGRDAMTAVGTPLGTPKYASPEQTRGDVGVDTRTDVFSLGMIVCEMLTGKLPRSATVSDTTPGGKVESPSRLLPSERSRLRGDLDRIVLKAVDDTIDRRYDTAASLADDVERFLRGEPVLATKPSMLYSARKFVARRRVTSALLAAAVVAIVSGIAALSIGLERSHAAEQNVRVALAEASAERDRTDAINSFLLGDVIDTLNPALTGEPLPGTDELLVRMSELAAEAFTDTPDTAYALFDRVGDAQRSLGLFEAAQEAKVRAMYAASEAFGPNDERTLRMQLDALLLTDVATDVSSEVDELERVARNRLGPDHPVALLAKVHALRRTAEPVQTDEVFDILARIERAGFAGTDLHLRAMVQLRTLLTDRGDPRGIEMLLDAVNLARRVHGPASSITLDYVGRAGSSLRQAGRQDEAIEMLSSAYEDARRTYGANQHVTKMLLNRVAVASLLGGRPEQGLRYAEGLYAIATSAERPDAYFASIGAMLIARGHEALGAHNEAVRWRRERLDRMFASTTSVQEHHVPRARLIMTLVRADRIAEAETEFQSLCDAGGPYDQFRFSAALMLARALSDEGRTTDALSLLAAEGRAEAYPPETVEQLDAWIERLGHAP